MGNVGNARFKKGMKGTESENPVEKKSSIQPRSGFYSRDVSISESNWRNSCWEVFSILCMELLLHRNLSVTSGLKLHNFMSIFNNSSWLCTSRQ